MGTKGPDRGKAEIYVDGKLVTPSHIDLYSPSYQYQSSLFEWSDRTIACIRSKSSIGEKNPKSSGNYLSFDVLKVISDGFEID